MASMLLSAKFPTAAANLVRRDALDRYGIAVQVSTVAFILVLSAVSRINASTNTPASGSTTTTTDGAVTQPPPPQKKTKGKSTTITASTATASAPPAKTTTKTILGEPLPAIALVSLWLIFLLLVGVIDVPTSSNAALRDDYIFFTRLPAHLLASLLPIHVLLSNSSPLNPLPYLSGRSRASLLPYHRVLGWGFMLLFASHGGMYSWFYIRNNLLAKRLGDSDVQLGLALSTSFSVVGWASRRSVRRMVGRKWVLVHIAAAVGIGGLLWGHVVQTRAYVLEAVGIIAVGIVWRGVRALGSS